MNFVAVIQVSDNSYLYDGLDNESDATEGKYNAKGTHAICKMFESFRVKVLTQIEKAAA